MEPPPSASGDVASQLQLEALSRDEPETESRDEAESRQEGEADAEEEVEVEATGKMRIHGEAGVPGQDQQPTTEEGKALIQPNCKE